ncbi:MAG: tetratricopeptide repeat protein [Nitrospirae bacterium]|nr:tetratricopeptide repeat protein [Nitrospirota bacterium]
MNLNAKTRYVLLFLLVLLSFSVYISTLSNDFVWDDKYEVLSNEWIKDFAYLPDIFFSHSLGWLKPEQSSTKYGPLKLLVRLLQYHISGTDPWAYQVTNVLVHALTSVMVFLVCARLFLALHGENSVMYPFAASLLFAVHPIHTEPVNWAIGLSELSMTFFCLLSFYLFMKSTGNTIRAHVLPGLLMFIAILFKVTAVFFLPVFVAYTYALSRSSIQPHPNSTVPRGILLKRYMPIALALVAYFSLFFLVTAGESDPVKTNHIRLDTYNLMLNMPLLLFQYMEKLVLPLQLNVLYVFHPVSSIAETTFLLPLCFMIIYFFIMMFTMKKNIMLSLCSVWIIAPLLPCLYLPATGYSYYVFAERYLYLPSAGYVILIAALSRIAVKRSFFNRQTIPVIVSLFAITGMYFGILTVQRNQAWKSDFILWSDTVEKSPDSDVAHNNLGVAYEHKGLFDDALREYETAISLNPTYMEAYDNRFRVMRLK